MKTTENSSLDRYLPSDKSNGGRIMKRHQINYIVTYKAIITAESIENAVIKAKELKIFDITIEQKGV